MSDETKKCPFCGQEIPIYTNKCNNCGQWLEDGQLNMDSLGEKAPLPREYQKFNWGAFLLTWIWGLGNNTYIALLALLGCVCSLIPLIGWIIPIVFAVWLGTQGNAMAWENKEWASLEEFAAVQRKWAMWGAIIWAILFVLLGILILLIFALAILSK